MTDPQPAAALPAYPSPHAAAPPRPRRSGLGCLFGMSVFLNLILFFLMAVAFLALLSSMGEDPEQRLPEKFQSGKTGASDKVAVVRIEGVIVEGMIDYVRKQIDQAAKDDRVKAVVLRINSPGGSITASDELHRRIHELCQGAGDRKGKPAVVSMGALAASGGYYVAMPVPTLYAERTTLTGSIGVFASFPNVKELSDKIGLKMEVVKAGAVKDAGSPFKDMTPQDRQLWQDMVDHAYEQFLQVVRDGRPQIKDQLTDVVIDRTIPVFHPPLLEPVEEKYTRTRVDGGIFTADQAKKFGLIDHIGFLEDAVKHMATKVGLGEDYQAVTYERPRTLAERLLGVQASPAAWELDVKRLTAAATPRLWYLAPQSELAGLLAVTGR